MCTENLELRLKKLGICIPVVATIKKGFESGKLSSVGPVWSESLQRIELLAAAIGDEKWNLFRDEFASSSPQRLQELLPVRQYNDPRAWLRISGSLRYSRYIRLIAALHAWVLNFGQSEFGMTVAARMAEVLISIRIEPDATVRFLESQTSLAQADYSSDGAKVAIDALEQQFSPDEVSEFLKALCRNLGAAGRSLDVISVIESHIGIAGKKYDGKEFRNAVNRFRDSRSVEMAAGCIRTLANHLRFTSRRPNALTLIESFAGLSGNIYGTDRWRQAIHSLNQRLSSDAAAYFWLVLSTQLLTAGRKFDALTLLEHQSCLSGQTYGSSDWMNAVGEFENSVTNVNFVNFTNRLCVVLGLSGKPHQAVCLAEFCAGIADKTYGSKPWSQAIQNFRDKVSSGLASSFCQILAEQLNGVDRSSDALILLENHLQFHDLEYGSDNWAEKLEQYSSRVSLRDGIAFLIPTANMLGLAERNSDAVTLLESYLGLSQFQYGSENWVSRVAWCCDTATVDNVVTILRVLAHQLFTIERENDARVVLEFLVHPPISARHDLFDNVVVDNSVPIINRWVGEIGTTSGKYEAFIEIGEKTVEYLRKNLDAAGVRILDRQILLDGIRELRKGLIDAVRQWARRFQKDSSKPTSTVRKLQTKAILWDLMFRQKILNDRLRTQQLHRPTRNSSFPSAEPWPFHEPYAEVIAPAAPLTLGFVGSLASTNSPAPQTVAPTNEEQSVMEDSLYLEFDSTSEKTLTESDLAKQLGKTGMMLHISLEKSGGLSWWLLKSTESQEIEIASFFSTDFSVYPRIQ